MSEQTPSQAEGERLDEPERTGRLAERERRERAHPDTPRTTPSQAEGERDEERRTRED